MCFFALQTVEYQQSMGMQSKGHCCHPLLYEYRPKDGPGTDRIWPGSACLLACLQRAVTSLCCQWSQCNYHTAAPALALEPPMPPRPLSHPYMLRCGAAGAGALAAGSCYISYNANVCVVCHCCGARCEARQNRAAPAASGGWPCGRTLCLHVGRAVS